MTILQLYLLVFLQYHQLNFAFSGEVRLVSNGVASGYHSGRVEIYHDGQWGTVCDDSWDDVDATVVCNSLGFPAGMAVSMAAFGEGEDPIWMDNVDCQGYESTLSECEHAGWGNHNCIHMEDAGVECAVPGEGPIPIPEGPGAIFKLLNSK